MTPQLHKYPIWSGGTSQVITCKNQEGKAYRDFQQVITRKIDCTNVDRELSRKSRRPWSYLSRRKSIDRIQNPASLLSGENSPVLVSWTNGLLFVACVRTCSQYHGKLKNKRSLPFSHLLCQFDQPLLAFDPFMLNLPPHLHTSKGCKAIRYALPFQYFTLTPSLPGYLSSYQKQIGILLFVNCFAFDCWLRSWLILSTWKSPETWKVIYRSFPIVGNCFNNLITGSSILIFFYTFFVFRCTVFEYFDL